MLRIIAVAAIALLASIGIARAEALGIVTGGCGTGNLSNGIPYLTVDSAGRLCDQSGPGTITPTSPSQYTPVSDAASTALTIPSGATYAVVCAEVANHRYTWDGTTTPTASVGAQLLLNQCVPLTGSAVLAAFKIITQSAGGTFTVSYGK